ncbi:MAG: hypothetical protein ACXWAY_19395 [Acidimicrobiia bacterium]
MRVYLGCEKDHLPPRDADAPGVVSSVAAGVCPVCPGESLDVRADDSRDAWAWCGCCRSAWRLEGEGFACLPGQLVEEWE